jgi:polyphosphate kinase
MPISEQEILMKTTSKIYCDHSLLTCDKKITNDVAQVFNFYKDNYKTGQYNHLIVAPFYMRKKLVVQIKKGNQKCQRRKREPGLFLKMNSLVDEEIIATLYESQQQRVKIRLISKRNLFAYSLELPASVKTLKPSALLTNILTHSRVFIFYNNGEGALLYFFGRYDGRRNLDFRSEVAVPVFDQGHSKRIKRNT